MWKKFNSHGKVWSTLLLMVFFSSLSLANEPAYEGADSAIEYLGNKKVVALVLKLDGTIGAADFYGMLKDSGLDAEAHALWGDYNRENMQDTFLVLRSYRGVEKGDLIQATLYSENYGETSFGGKYIIFFNGVLENLSYDSCSVSYVEYIEQHMDISQITEMNTSELIEFLVLSRSVGC